jgi:ATP adenylyltransferase
MTECPFCERIALEETILVSPLSVAMLDKFPLNPGHILIVPKRHVSTLFDFSDDERADLFSLLPAIKSYIESRFSPEGYNLGMNIGEAAGQTVSHAHFHVIPRYRGDVADPRGGIRQVIPSKARYWESDP